jgi:glucokinase
MPAAPRKPRSAAAPKSPPRAARSATLRGGIDLGGTKIEAIIVDQGNKVLGQARHPTPTSGGPADVAKALAAAIVEAAKGAGTDTKALRGVGVGSPGTIDAAAGTVTSARNLPDWTGSFPLGPTLAAAIGTAVFLGNDVSVATTAEYRLASAADGGARSLLGVFWGTGVGGGLILNGEPWHGRGGAGEIGHMVVKRGGRRCPCGRRGCMEAYAGRGAMEARARRQVEKGHTTKLFELMEDRGRTRLTSAVWWHAIDGGDHLAIKLIDQAIEALGAGIASAVNLLDPDEVVIGGGLGVRFGEPYVARIRRAMHPHLFEDGNPAPVRLAALGDLGGALGAALLVQPTA